MKSAIKPVVLAVDDEPIILAFAMSFIEDAGYDAISATNADDAVAILEERSDIQIVFSDNDMPGSMNGLKLANAVRDRWPPVELILTSGKVISAESLPTRALFFSKPYVVEHIVNAMHSFIRHSG